MSDVRVRKLQEFIKQEVSQMLMRGLKDPRIGFTTITDVHVTGDLREATIYVSLFGSDKEKQDTLIALQHAAGHIRTELGKVLRYSMHIESLLNEIKKDEHTRDASSEDDTSN